MMLYRLEAGKKNSKVFQHLRHMEGELSSKTLAFRKCFNTTSLGDLLLFVKGIMRRDGLSFHF